MSKRAETDIVLSVFDVRAYIVSFSASFDMNQVPEKLYLGQNLKQYVMKEAVIYKILRYRQNRCHTNEERWTEHSWHKAKIQHPQQCQSVFTVESQDNILNCTKTHIIKRNSYIPSIPIDFVLPKLLNYLAFQSLILSYLMKVIPETFMCTKFDIYVFITSF